MFANAITIWMEKYFAHRSKTRWEKHLVVLLDAFNNNYDRCDSFGYFPCFAHVFFGFHNANVTALAVQYQRVSDMWFACCFKSDLLHVVYLISTCRCDDCFFSKCIGFDNFSSCSDTLGNFIILIAFDINRL